MPRAIAPAMCLAARVSVIAIEDLSTEESERYLRGYWPERFGMGSGSEAASCSGSGPTTSSSKANTNGEGDGDGAGPGPGKVIASSSIDVDVDTDTDVKHDTNAEDSEAARNGDSDSAERAHEEELQRLSLWDRREMIRVHIGCRVELDSDAKRTM
jgi:hypothetical protein